MAKAWEEIASGDQPLAQSEEDVLSYALFPQVARPVPRAARARRATAARRWSPRWPGCCWSASRARRCRSGSQRHGPAGRLAVEERVAR